MEEDIAKTRLFKYQDCSDVNETQINILTGSEISKFMGTLLTTNHQCIILSQFPTFDSIHQFRPRLPIYVW